MDVEPRLSEWIRQKIIEFSSDTSNEPEYIKELAEHFQVLPLLIDWTAFWGIRPDGDFILVPTEEDALPTVEIDSRIRTTVLYQGAKKYSELASLVPQRPERAQDCPHCEGKGRIDIEGIEPDVIVCYCGGTGWLH